MRLTLGDGRVILNPSRETIEAALQTLAGGPGSFAIIEDDTGRTPDLFLQGTGGPDNFHVEYAEAIAEYDDEIEARHFRGRQEVMQETLAVMFESFTLGDGTWKGMIPWEDTTTPTEEYGDDADHDAAPEGTSQDPWARKSGCLSLLALTGLVATALILALGVL